MSGDQQDVLMHSWSLYMYIQIQVAWKMYPCGIWDLSDLFLISTVMQVVFFYTGGFKAVES